MKREEKVSKLWIYTLTVEQMHFSRRVEWIEIHFSMDGSRISQVKTK